MDREVTFIHAADLHLDSPFKGLMDMPAELFEEIKESTFQALLELVRAAIENRVDFVLITGDLFDNEKQSLKAQIRLKKAFEQLKEQEIEVFLSYGNHDFLNGNIHQVTYPDNVHLFPDEQVRALDFYKNGEVLAKIYGFSYENRAVIENKTSEYVIEDQATVPFHIAMLHGSIQGNEEHDTYAPFRLSELMEKDFRYWALGHIHKRAVLKEDPYIVYPGNIQGRHRKETGEKGCYLVQLTESQTVLEFIPLNRILFVPLTVDVSECEAAYQLETILTEKLKTMKTSKPQLIDLTLQANDSKLRNWQTDGQLEDIVEIINESFTTNPNWRYIFHVQLDIQEMFELRETQDGEHFIGELQRTFERNSGMDYLEQLYQHRQARKFLELPSQEEVSEWKETARSSLFDQLLRGGRR